MILFDPHLLGVFLFLHNSVHLYVQRQEKYTELRLKAVKARNEYLLTVEASNAATTKYFEEDLSLIVDVSLITAIATAAAA